jgi:hypothetical protein
VLFTNKTKAEHSTLEDVKNALTTALGNKIPGSEEYETILGQLERVQTMIAKNPSWSFKPSADVILTSAVSIVLAVAVLNHEQTNVITTKAWSFMPKLTK